VWAPAGENQKGKGGGGVKKGRIVVLVEKGRVVVYEVGVRGWALMMSRQTGEF